MTTVRLATRKDVASVDASQSLADADFQMASRFGCGSLTTASETSVVTLVSVVTMDETTDIVMAAATFHDRPMAMDAPAAADWHWMLEKACESDDYSPVSSIFLTYAYLNEQAGVDELNSLLSWVFAQYPEKSYVLMCLPTGQNLFRPADNVFRSTNSGDINLFVANRSQYFPQLKVRTARVEDHDDLVPVFAAQSELLTEKYGEYFLAHLIESQDDHTKALVADVQGKPVALMSLTDELDVDVLSESFYLEPYDNLCKSAGVAEGTSEEAMSAAEGASLLPNAFCITLFCLEENFQCRSRDFLQSAFELFEDRDYCILTLPYSAPESALLKDFTAVPMKLENSFSHTLYIFHRDALYTSVKVRLATSLDKDEVLDLMAADSAEDVATMEASLEGHAGEVAAYVATVADTVIGCALLRSLPEPDVLDVMSHYDIETLVGMSSKTSHKHASLRLFIINPIFARRSKLFLSEMLRLSGKVAIYLHVESADDPPPPVLTEFVPVKPRTSVRSCQAYRKSNKDMEHQYALFAVTTRLLGTPYTTWNTRVVVVGASDTSMGMVEDLLLRTDLRLSNLCLVTPGGLAACASPPPYANLSLAFDSSRINQLAMSHRIDVVDGEVMSLDRDNKTVTTTSGLNMTFDVLVMCPGLQDQTLNMDDNGWNDLAGTFSLTQAGTFGRMQQYLQDEPFPTVCVYGGTLEAFSSVQWLLRNGVDGTSITLAIPPEPPAASKVPAPSCFNNPAVDEKIGEVLKNKGVTVIRDFALVDVVSDPSTGHVAAVSLSGGLDGYNAPCNMLITACAGEVNMPLFHTVNDAALVYDGRMVVDSNFSTVDPSIYASGTWAKFGRRFRAQGPLNAYNSAEVGRRLASCLLQAMSGAAGKDPSIAPPIVSDQAPKFKAPVVQASTCMPGDMVYLHSALPNPAALRTPLTERMKEPNYGRELITTNGGTNYFRLHIDR